MAILVIEHSDRAGSDRLGETLRDHGHRLRVVRVHREEALPPNLDDIDGIVSCGGPQQPGDDALPWLAAELDLIRRAHEAELPVVGLCLGSQLVARALGGTTRQMEGGIEFAFHDVALTPGGREDPIFAGIPWVAKQFEHHRHEVAELPSDARLLASSERCRAQAWVCGVRTYGFQYHPEMHERRVEEWLADEPGILDEAGLSNEALRRQVEEHFPAFTRLAERLFESLALYLMPVDRRHAGVAKDLHH
jgi:GMP synthase-like glutamine amidotransferase